MPSSKTDRMMQFLMQGVKGGQSMARQQEAAKNKGMNPLELFLAKQEAKSAQKDEDALQSEAAYLTARGDKRIGKIRDKYRAASELRSLFESGDPLSMGQVKAAIAKMQQGGRLSDKDIELILPGSYKELLNNARVWMGMEPDHPLAQKFGFNEALTPEQSRSIAARIANMSSDTGNQIRLAQDELLQQSQYLAPNMHRKGTARDLIESLGVAGLKHSPQVAAQFGETPLPGAVPTAKVPGASPNIRIPAGAPNVGVPVSAPQATPPAAAPTIGASPVAPAAGSGLSGLLKPQAQPMNALQKARMRRRKLLGGGN